MNRLFILAAILIFIVFPLACTEEETISRQVEKDIDLGDDPDQISWDYTVYFYDSTRVKAILNGRRARIYEERKETLLDSSVKAEFMSLETGNRASVLTADSAKIDDNTQNMIAEGNVVVVSDSNNTTLRTSKLQWDNESQKLFSTEFVTIVSPYEEIQGYGFESDPNLTNYKIMKVSGVQK